ncbi:glycine cleavage system aminomethyltransferase GcvT [Bacteriovoracaceae bacterium]|nr:glycine cleavage system aminomethyltransferase GcvT [Bacteriovoracaceae bacterium]
MTELKTTALYHTHENLKAKLVPFAGFKMPLNYSDIKTEVAAIRNKAGAFDVSHMGIVEITGDKINEFIDHLITNNYSTLKNMKAVYSPIINEKGGIIDDLICYKINQKNAYIVFNASNIEKDLNWMNQVNQDFNNQINFISDQTGLLAVQGPEAFDILIKEFNFPTEIKDLPPFSLQEITFEGETLLLATTGYTGEKGCELFVPNNIIADFFAKLVEFGVTPCGLAARDVLRLEVAYPLYGNDLTINHNPYECGLAWTVKLKKENFLGKTAIENKKTKVKLKKFVLDKKSIPRQGYKVLNENDREIGVVSSGTFSPTIEKGIAMAHIETVAISETENYYIQIRNKKVQATEITGNFLD